ADDEREPDGPGLDGRGSRGGFLAVAPGYRLELALEPAAVTPQCIRSAQQRGEELQEHRQLRHVPWALRGGGAAELGQALTQRPRRVVQHAHVVGRRIAARFDRAEQEIFLAGEVPVDGSLGYLRRLGNLLQRGRGVAALA